MASGSDPVVSAKPGASELEQAAPGAGAETQSELGEEVVETVSRGGSVLASDVHEPVPSAPSAPYQVVRAAREAILSLRDGLKDVYGRVVGPKTILYHLHRDPILE